MTRTRLGTLLERLRQELPEVRLHVREYRDEEDPALEAVVHLLDVPVDRLVAVEDRAWAVAREVVGDGPLPVLFAALGPAQSAVHFPRATKPRRPARNRARAR